MRGNPCFLSAGGVWYKGTVVDLKQAQPGKDAPPEEKERYDPWESLVVHWDRGGWGQGLRQGRVSGRRVWAGAQAGGSGRPGRIPCEANFVTPKWRVLVCRIFSFAPQLFLDAALPDENETVSPWELEIDPDEERRRAEEARRQVQAAARAQRARQSSRRWACTMRQLALRASSGAPATLVGFCLFAWLSKRDKPCWVAAFSCPVQERA